MRFNLRIGTLLFLALSLITLCWLYHHYWDSLLLQWMVLLIVSRGIIAPNRTWWSISETALRDASGIEMYRRLKLSMETGAPVLKMPIMGWPVNIVYSNEYVRQILNGSPYPFGVGAMKRNFFQSFMSKNLGVSQGLDWRRRRQDNEVTLDTNQLVHTYAPNFATAIRNVFHKALLPRFGTRGRGRSRDNEDNKTRKTWSLDFDDFNRVARRITGAIVFGDEDLPLAVFQLFGEANSMKAVLGKMDLTNSPTMKIYQHYLLGQIQCPRPFSLVARAKAWMLRPGSTIPPEGVNEELLHQIPHWIFPTVGLINTNVPRVLLLLNQSQNRRCEGHEHQPQYWDRLRQELRRIAPCDFDGLLNLPLLRASILETLRLNNPVVTTFRTLLTDYDFASTKEGCPARALRTDIHHAFKKGEQFLILNNPVLREEDFWCQADTFIPERWIEQNIENSYHAISFNQGPQKCPGKNLTIFIMSCAIKAFLDLLDDLGIDQVQSEPQINMDDVRQMINPYRIAFTLHEAKSQPSLRSI